MSKPRLIILVLVALITSNALWHRYKPLPEGLAMHDGPLPAHNLALLVDDTWENPNGERGIRQQIFSEMFRLIRQAQKLVVVDMFLFNDFQGTATSSHRPLARELTDVLLAKRQQQVPVILVTDPINTLYGGLPSEHLEQLEKAGVTVVMTPLGTLRDSNPSWSGLWRLCCQWLGNDDDGGWLPNPMGPGKITLRSYLALPNFKANHRKTLVVDEGNDWTAMVTSANPHDGSSGHSNIALRFSGSSVGAVVQSELKIAELANVALPPRPAIQPIPATHTEASLEVLTEAAIRDALLETVARSEASDTLDVAVFYLSHRPLVEALKAAHDRGVQVRVLLDPNKDAFGRQKNGIPNRPVGAELHKAGITVRWCNTQGEQCHSKMLMRQGKTQAELILGSANFTRRNLDNLNLETSVRLVTPANHPVMREASQTFLRRWENRHGEKHSLDYEAYADEVAWKKVLYRVMEFSGWSSF